MTAEENGVLANIDDLRRKAAQVAAGHHLGIEGLSQDEVVQLMGGLLDRVSELEEQNEAIHHELAVCRRGMHINNFGSKPGMNRAQIWEEQS